MPWHSDGAVDYEIYESLSGSCSDSRFTSTSPGEAFTDSDNLNGDGDPIHVHKRLALGLGGPPWLHEAVSLWPRFGGSFRATAVDLQNLQITGRRLLQVTADPPSERAPVQPVRAAEPLRILQDSFPPSGPRTAAPISPWLRHHPILGAVLQGEPPQARPLLPDATSRPLSPRDSNWTGLTSTPRVDPSPRQSEARLQETQGEGLREVDREILEQLRALSEAVKAISTNTSPGSTAEKQDTVADQLAAKRAAEAKKRLLSASCLALGVKDDRLMLVDCFLSWSHAWRSSKEAPKDTSTRDAAAQAEDRSPASHLPEEAAVEDPSGPVLPVLADHAIRALLGEEVWLDPDGSLHGASLWLSMTPPQASRRFLQTFDICLPEEVPSAMPSAPLQEVSIQTSPRQGQLMSGSSQEASPKVTPKHQRGAEDVTPERVLQRISGLMTEMTAMETSLENLREQMEKAPDLDLEPLLELEEDEGFMPPAAPKQEPRSRLRSRLPASLSWLEEAARKGRPSIPMQSRSHAPKRAPRNPRRAGLRSSAH